MVAEARWQRGMMPNRPASGVRLYTIVAARRPQYPLNSVMRYSDFSLPFGVSVAGIRICRKQRTEAAKEIGHMPCDFCGREPEDLPTIEHILADPAASDWLKAALHSALSRDPVDAANDAEVLAKVLDRWCRQMLEHS